jgi:hypothetical protein
VTGGYALARTIRIAIALAVIGSSLLSNPGGIAVEGDETSTTIKVTCTEPEGCYRLLSQAIANAPEGATIELSPGLFYEPPILIDKSITIRGSGSQTVIQAVTPGILLRIHNPNPDDALQVVLEDVTLRYWILPVEAEPAGSIIPEAVLRVEGVAGDRDPENSSAPTTRVILRRSGVSSVVTAIGVSGAEFLLEDTWIRTRSGAFSIGAGSQFPAVNNRIVWLGGLPSGEGAPALIGLSGAAGELRQNLIINGKRAPPENSLPGVLIFGEGRYTFQDNEISNLAVGVLLGGGSISVEFLENAFKGNGVGIFVNIPPCVPHPAPETRFSGTIAGRDNVFVDNKRDLCPDIEEGPWPPGFVKRTE